MTKDGHSVPFIEMKIRCNLRLMLETNVRNFPLSDYVRSILEPNII